LQKLIVAIDFVVLGRVSRKGTIKHFRLTLEVRLLFSYLLRCTNQVLEALLNH